MQRNLILITGQEGAGKSTIVHALLAHTPNAAQIDAEDVGQVNPFKMNEAFLELLWKNVLSLVNNFWEVGYSNVIAGSFLSTYKEFKKFRERLPEDSTIYIVQLCASKKVRDTRRIERAKPTNKEWRDQLDQLYPEDQSLQQRQDEYSYIRIQNDNLSAEEVVSKIRKAFPDIYS